MTRVRPLSTDEVGPAVQEAVAKQTAQLGLVPNSLLTMAHRPEIASAWATLAGAVSGEGTVERALKQLVAHVSSTAHGCRYCQAHTGHKAEGLGVEREKLQAAWDYESSELFTDAERAALRLAHHASLVPNEATDAHFDDLRQWFSDEQIVEIVAVIAMFGWLNRWNDTMATTLEQPGLDWAREALAPARGWEAGMHDPQLDPTAA